MAPRALRWPARTVGCLVLGVVRSGSLHCGDWCGTLVTGAVQCGDWCALQAKGRRPLRGEPPGLVLCVM
jgi:hypothetical protein